ncbi:kinase-like domain-containing protein, partial [Morchella snyderi]
KLETEFEGEYIIQRVGTWDKGSSTKLWTTSRWENKRVIGSGSFGTVWLQKNLEYHEGGLRVPGGIGQLRAVKTVPRDLSQGATLSQELLAFLKLKQVLNDQFDHLFVGFHGWYEDTNNTFIVMEYVEHGDLSQYVQKSREGASALRSLMEVKEITRQILEGLEVLHSKRIYHRDLKPQNILIASFDPIWVKIADFGLSKQAKNTSIRTRAGTHGYLAPEIIGCNRREYKTQFVPHALDIWSLGCLVYELLAFEPPFLEQELDEGEYCRDEVPFPAKLLKERSDLPVGEEEASFIRKLLIPNPADRPTAAGALQSSWL